MDKKVLELLVCPVTKEPLVYNATAQQLISVNGKRVYPIVDGIPVMLVEQSSL